MSYQVLARKWRPRDFSQLTGQEHVVQALSNALDSDRLHHAFLFTGTRGVGKTTIARILAKCLNCETGVSSTPCGSCPTCVEIDEGRFVDLIEIDAASRTGVDDTREMLENVPYAPGRGHYKVYLIDEVHMFSKGSFNALLKTLEEPPPHVKFLLATTDPQRLPVTVLSRCLQFNLKRLSAEQIRANLEHITSEEGLSADAAALQDIAIAADGSIRDSLSLLDQAIVFGGGSLQGADTRRMLGTVDRARVYALADAIAAGDAGEVLAQAATIAEFVTDFDAVLSDLAGILQQVAVQQLALGSAGREGMDIDRIRALAAQLGREDVQLYYQIAIKGREDLRFAPDPRTGFDMTLLRMLAFKPAEANQRPPAGVPGQSGAKPQVGAAAPAQSAAPSSARPADKPPSAVQEAPAAAPSVAATPENWTALVAMLPLVGMTREMANNAVLLRRDGDQFVLGIAPQHEQLFSAQQQAKLAAALGAYLGCKADIKLQVGDLEAETPAAGKARAAQQRQAAAEASIEADPNVQRLKATFDAKVVPNSVKPVNQ